MARAISQSSSYSVFALDPRRGTGIVNSLFFNLPWESSHAVFRALGAVWLVLAMILFFVFSILTITRYTIYPRIAIVMLRHETHSLFLGCIPMGLVTIVTGIALTGHEYGINSLNAALVLWWIALGKFPFTPSDLPNSNICALIPKDDIVDSARDAHKFRSTRHNLHAASHLG